MLHVHVLEALVNVSVRRDESVPILFVPLPDPRSQLCLQPWTESPLFFTRNIFSAFVTMSRTS